jgi:hypothetical protein
MAPSSVVHGGKAGALCAALLFAMQCDSAAPKGSPAVDLQRSAAKTRPDAGTLASSRHDVGDAGSHETGPGDGAPPADPNRLYVVAGSIDVVANAAASAPILGTVRAGGSVELRLPVTAVRADRDCPEGWYAALPQGFVCAGKGTTRDGLAPAVRILKEYRLAAHAALPASYGVAEMTPVYLRVPTFDEQVRSEPNIEQHLHKLATVRESQDAARASGYASEGREDLDVYPAGVEVPDDLRGGSFAPLSPKPLLPGSPVTGLLNGGSRIAWVAEFDATDRTWLLTPDLLFVPRDKVKRGVVSGFHGVEVPKGAGVAFIGQKPERRYRKSEDGKRFVVQRETWAPGTAVFLAEPAARWSDDKFLESTEPGVFLRVEDAITAHPTPASRWGLDPDSPWIEINAKTHLLLLHEGSSVSFATLVSVGMSEAARGKFRVFSKHLSLATPFDRPRAGGMKAEVPEVMLVSDTPDAIPFALFAAWWVTSWGAPNGCAGVALSPLDARRLFDWTTPVLPEGWHSAHGEGTWVVLHD